MKTSHQLFVAKGPYGLGLMIHRDCNGGCGPSWCNCTCHLPQWDRRRGNQGCGCKMKSLWTQNITSLFCSLSEWVLSHKKGWVGVTGTEHLGMKNSLTYKTRVATAAGCTTQEQGVHLSTLQESAPCWTQQPPAILTDSFPCLVPACHPQHIQMGEQHAPRYLDLSFYLQHLEQSKRV